MRKHAAPSAPNHHLPQLSLSDLSALQFPQFTQVAIPPSASAHPSPQHHPFAAPAQDPLAAPIPLHPPLSVADQMGEPAPVADIFPVPLLRSSTGGAEYDTLPFDAADLTMHLQQHQQQPPQQPSGLTSPAFSPVLASASVSTGFNSPIGSSPPQNSAVQDQLLKRALSMQALRNGSGEEEKEAVNEDLSGAFREGLGISGGLGSPPVNQQGQQGQGGSISLDDKAVVNNYFDEMQAKIEAMRSAVLQGHPEQLQQLTHAVQVFDAPAPQAPPQGRAPPQAQQTQQSQSVRSSRSGSVSSYMNAHPVSHSHSHSGSIDSSSASSPPLSFPYTTTTTASFLADPPDNASVSARSLKRSASFSDWDEEEVEMDSGRGAKIMRLSSGWATSGEDDTGGEEDGWGGPPQLPPLVHHHSFPSMHDLPSQTGTTVRDQPLASPIPPRIPTISNATIVPNLPSSTAATPAKPPAGLSHLRLQHLQIDTSGSGAVGSVPTSPVDYVPHPMPSYYPIQTWVNSTLPYVGFDALGGMSGTEPFPTFGEQDAFMSPAGQGEGYQQGYMVGQQDQMSLEFAAFQSPTLEWPPSSAGLEFPSNASSAIPAPLQAAEAGTTPMPTSLMQQSAVAAQAMAHAHPPPGPPPHADNRSAPSLSRSASRISGITKRPRKQASLSVVPKITDIKPLVSPIKLAPRPPADQQPGEIVPPAPPPMGPQVQPPPPPSAFKMGFVSPDEGGFRIKSEAPSRSISRQASLLSFAGQVDRSAMDFQELVSRKLAGAVVQEEEDSPEDGDDEDEEMDAWGGGGAKRKGVSRNSSLARRRALGVEGSAQSLGHTNSIAPDMKSEVDRVFFEFLNRLCSNLDMTDAKGELIHQALMPKKMQKLDESPDFRPFKFRIQAFTNAFVEELNRQGYSESMLPLKKIRTYLWSQPYISRYNEDGRKSKSKGNHIWNIHAKKLGDNRGWIFREYHRKITGTPAGLAYIGLEWRWSPSIWDPQQSRSSMHPSFSSPVLPPWLTWKDNELFGTPSVGDQGGDFVAHARVIIGDVEETLTHQFHLEVVELPPGEAMALQKPRRPSESAASDPRSDPSSAPPPKPGRGRSHTMSTALTSESEMPPVPRLPPPVTQAARQEHAQIREVLQAAAARIAQEATLPVAQTLPEAARRQRQASLAKQQEVLSMAVQAFNYVSYSTATVPANFTELVAASKRVVKEAARQVAERTGASQAREGGVVSPPTVPMNEVILTTRVLITQAINDPHVGLGANEIDIMRAASASAPSPLPTQPAQQQKMQAPMPMEQPASLVHPDGADFQNDVPMGFQNLASIHPPDVTLDLNTFSFPPTTFNNPGMNHPNQSQ